MTSYADDNRSLFAARNRKYTLSNRSSERKCPTQTQAQAQPQQSCAQNRADSRAVSVRQTQTRKPAANTASTSYRVTSVHHESQSAFRAAAEQYRRYAKARDEKRAAENAKVIRSAMRAGVKKVEYVYDDYAVEEHNFPISFAALAIAFTVIAVFLLLNCSQITKYSNDISDLENEMTEYNAEIAEYEILLGKRTDHTTVEAYASAAGLVSSDKVESRYINMTDNYKLEKSNGASQEDAYTVSTVMSGVVRLFSEALGG